MSELFIEIGVEEIPVAEIEPAIEHLSSGVRQLLESVHIDFGDAKAFSTPRRLTVCIEGLADKGRPEAATYTGPRKEAAFDKDGNSTQAAIGFARSKGIDVKALKIVKLDKGEFVQAEIKRPGVSTKSLIKERLTSLILGMPFRKSMRWDSENIRFIRPIRWLVVLYNGKVIPVSIGGVKASSYTYGLRTGGSKKIKVSGFDSWDAAMRREKILPVFAKRIRDIRKQAINLAKRVGGDAIIDNYLHNAITNLVESPIAIQGGFDPRFMNIPEEVIISVMETQQRYIPVKDDRGKLMPYFIGISNNPYGDKRIIRKGYEKVLRARLEDAEFYYEQDTKRPLESYVELLKGMVFYPKLGSLYDKTERIATIASFLADTMKMDERTRGVMLKAARLCKADLATRLVSEFPELQGLIGHHYILLKDPSDKTTALVVAEQYSQPVTIPGAMVYIADKIDSLVGFFSIGEVPTGTQDPYGLRRAAIGILNILLSTMSGPQIRIELSIKALIDFGIAQYKHINNKEELKSSLLHFFYTRLEGILAERYANIKKFIDAVLATEPENIYEVGQRTDALKDIVFKPDFEPVFLAFKRVINISKKHIAGEIKPDLLVEPSEKSLYDKYLNIESEIKTVLAKRDYIGYIKSLEKIVPEINTFFDKVLVMSDDEGIRTNRLNLLAKVKNLVMQVLDITKLI
ncbi:MAG: glycine--tRNA ligase subunit beta [Deltaproteobacteria bacterium]|nr:glycine--tRNA ligase subunit beta [Deltaproteobacteria bacterium]